MEKNLLINKNYLKYLNNTDNLIYLFDSYTLLTSYIDYISDKQDMNMPIYDELGSDVSPYIIENLIYVLNYIKNTIHVNSFFTSQFNDEYNIVINNLEKLLLEEQL